MKHSHECLIMFPNTENGSWKTRCSRVLWRKFEVFGNMIKHSRECLIQLLKQIHTSGENKGESLANLCKCLITFPNPSRLWFSFVLASWIKMSFRRFGHHLRADEGTCTYTSSGGRLHFLRYSTYQGTLFRCKVVRTDLLNSTRDTRHCFKGWIFF